eukprot:2422380-Pyramimonas_sp.AAC.1
MLVRLRGAPVWHFSLGDARGVVALGWPAESVALGGGMVGFMPSATDAARKLHPLVILDPVKWEAKPVKWTRPLHVAADGGRSDGLVAMQDGDADSLWGVAAKKAFW